ncbi:cysteine hydrolase family protein [Rhizobium sp. RAF56]|uniref:cysteine hydrolase family protein n=1 Tax=Rhizobium sp. RAF56 TaxID=3233062 RepID=UPI003F98B0A2
MLGKWIHLCIDMQRMFADDTPWHVSWMREVSPQIEELVKRYSDRTVFTRFITPESKHELPGMWRAYYEKWNMMTREHLDPAFFDLVPSLKRFVPPARCFDKMTYSPWTSGELHRVLSGEGVATVVLTGGETDVCVLAAALGAIDLGYRVLVLRDAVCSGTDETHEAALELLSERFSVQLDLVETEDFLRSR